MTDRIVIGITLLALLFIVVGARIIGGIDPPPHNFVPVIRADEP